MGSQDEDGDGNASTQRDGSPDDATSAGLAPGTEVGRYRIAARIGAGAMGVVYQAFDTELARDVALKVVRPREDLEVMEARLRREAQAMARLSHSNVVPVFDIGTHDGQLYLAMELIDGEVLRTWIKQPRRWRQVVRMYAKAGRGLHAAHAAGLVHRDFKPDNVMIGPGGEPRLTDFGLARDAENVVFALGTDPGDLDSAAFRNAPLGQVTATGSIAGTPAYMAPEQLLGRPVGPAADQFSFCVSLFEALHGARPFVPSLDEPGALIAEIYGKRIVKPAMPRAVPRFVETALARGLAFDPKQRWPSMVELVGALDPPRHTGRWLAVAAVAVAAAVAFTITRCQREAIVDCDTAIAGGDAGVAVVACGREADRTNDPFTRAKHADALRRNEQPGEAVSLATQLLATPAKAEAHDVLGKVAARARRSEEAKLHLGFAISEHVSHERWSEAAADEIALAEVYQKDLRGLRLLVEAIAHARRGGDRAREGKAHVAAARMLSLFGAYAGARSELDRAGALIDAPHERMLLLMEDGNLRQRLGDNAGAVPRFLEARELASREPNLRQARTAHLNLVWSLAELGRLSDAAGHLVAAAALDIDHAKAVDRKGLAAKLAFRRGELELAAGLTEEAYDQTKDDDDKFELEVMRAEIAFARGAFEVADAWARRAIDRTDRPRRSIDNHSRLMGRRRLPYELLFASLALRGDAAGALAVLEAWQGRAVLDELARGDLARIQLTHGTGAIDQLAERIPMLDRRALGAPTTAAMLRETEPLLALVVARGGLWRLASDGAAPSITNLGPIAALQPRLAVPVDPALGALVVPPALAAASPHTLHVSLDEQLALIPIERLRIGDRTLAELRPIVRVARPTYARCALWGARGGFAIIDVDGELQRTHRAATALANRTSATVAAGALATTGALLAADAGDLVYVAAHTGAAAGDADELVLRSSRVSALELASRGTAPTRVVLASGGSPTLAMAYVAAGAAQVIAPIREVSDDEAAQLTARLTGRGLGDVDRAAISGLGYAVFGRELCQPSSED